MQPADLVRLAELIRLGARSVQLFPDTIADGHGQHAEVARLGQQIETAADELLAVAQAIEAGSPQHN